MVEPSLEDVFPGLRDQPYQIKSPRDHRYNCIAFAVGITTQYWWPNPAFPDPCDDYWPAGVPNEETMEAFIQALATVGFGTALGVIYAAVEAGKRVKVYADETRPFLQGSRLTAWELAKENIPVTLITDSMAGHFLKSGEVDCVIVGADRVAANGDVANKIGTYMVAIAAHENNIPFYVAAPLSTVDLTLTSGEQIPIESRADEEVTHFRGQQVAPEGVKVANPAFDVTPHRYVSAIITDAGVAREPYDTSLKALFENRG